MSARAFTDEVVAKVEAHGVYRVGYPDRASAERLIQQLREAIAAERAAIAELIEAGKEYDSAEVAWHALYPDDAAHVKYPKPLNSPEYLRWQRAVARRAAALRAVGGA